MSYFWTEFIYFESSRIYSLQRLAWMRALDILCAPIKLTSESRANDSVRMIFNYPESVRPKIGWLSFDSILSFMWTASLEVHSIEKSNFRRRECVCFKHRCVYIIRLSVCTCLDVSASCKFKSSTLVLRLRTACRTNGQSALSDTQYWVSW